MIFEASSTSSPEVMSVLQSCLIGYRPKTCQASLSGVLALMASVLLIVGSPLPAYTNEILT